MLTQEERLLADLVLSRQRLSMDRISVHARAARAGHMTLVESLVTSGDLRRDEVDRLAERARALEAKLACELTLPRTLGEFRLIREIGRGGAGVVYEAIQLSLDRHVALKVLPAELVHRTASGTKVLQEARAAGRLRHQGIVTVFSAGEEDDLVYFAMDLVRGPSLAEQIQRGPVPPQTAATVARKVALSLEHAHQAGFIHRDIKPENILLESNHRPRVTDFGLVCELSDDDDSLTTHVLGTPAYMAPEQAEGGRLDVRTDVYGLGSVLYAMLAGEAPYSGELAAEVVDQVRAGPPRPLAELAPSTPDGLVAICERAMARDPEQRYAGAGAMANALEGFLSDGDVVSTRTPFPFLRMRYVMPAFFLAIALLAVVGWIRLQETGQEPWVPPPQLGLLRGRMTTIATDPDRIGPAALLPDGQRMAYVVERDGVHRLVVSPVDPAQRESRRGDTIAISPLHTDVVPAPDGRQVATGPGGLMEVLDLERGGRSSYRKCVAVDWSPDSREIACREPTRARLTGIDLATGTTRTIFSSTRLARDLAWSPHGQRIAFPVTVGGQPDLATIPAGGGDLVPLTDDDAVEWSAAWSHDGKTLYFGSDRGGRPDLWSVEIDEESGRARDEPRPLTRGLMSDFFRLSSARRHGRLLISAEASENLSRVRFDPEKRRFAGAPTRDRQFNSFARFPHRSPRDGAVVFTGGPDRDLRVLDSSAKDPTAWRLLTEGPATDEGARWSPAGDLIAFRSDASGSMEIWTVRPDGGDLLQRTDLPGRDATFPVWSPDGNSLTFGVQGGGGYLLALGAGSPTTEPSSPVELAPFEAPFVPWSWSADGERLLGVANGIVMYDFGTGAYERLTTFGEAPAWIGDTRALLFVHGNEIQHLDVDHGATVRVHSFEPNRLLPWLSLSERGTRLDYAIASPEDVLLLDFGRPAAAATD
ncbi:MAG: protein kinase [bacterium]|nr:protein kinase [bacterium]